MNHADVKKQLSDYLEGDLELADRARVDAHLDGCADCAGQVDEMRQMIRMLQTMPEPELPPMIAANVMRRIRAGETAPSFWQRVVRGISGVLEPSFVLPASAIAVAALVTLVVRDPNLLDRWRTAESGAASGLAEQVGRSNSRAGLLADGVASGAPGPSSSFESVASELPRSSAAQRATRAPVQYRFHWSTSVSDRAGQQIPPGFSAPAGARAGRSRFAENLAEPRTFSDSSAVRAGALRVAQPMAGNGAARGDSSGGDPRDEWLARGFEDPVGFAAFLESKSLAEQELWVARLAERAQARGLFEELVGRLRESGDVSAAILSDDFIAQLDRQAAIGVAGGSLSSPSSSSLSSQGGSQSGSRDSAIMER